MRPDLEMLMPVEWAGLVLRNPLIVASGPTNKTVSQLMQAEQSGWGAISTKLIIDPEPYINRKPRYRWMTKDHENYHIFTLEARLNMEEGLRLVEEGRKKTRDLIIFANITYEGPDGPDGWARMAKRIEAAGAHALELNFCCPNMSFNLDTLGEDRADREQTGASIGSNPQLVASLTKLVKAAVSIPVCVKLTPETNMIGPASKAAADAGADAACGTANRLGVPPLDIYNLDNVVYRLQKDLSLSCLSGSWIRPLALRDVLQMRQSCGSDVTLIGTGGVKNFQDTVEMVMCGADLVGICTEVMLYGFNILPQIMRELRSYLNQMGKTHLSELRDLALPHFKTSQDVVSYEGYARVNPEVCTQCGRCVEIGHCLAIEMGDETVIIHREECNGCSTCIDICPVEAIAMVQEDGW
jgi:dihydroorotate dehydrogenase/NAD-dependent dihydropyrimidine dehydrogenase PreA subunit